MMKRLAIIGSGDLGQQIAHHAITDKQFEVIGFFDDFAPKGIEINHIPVLGSLEEVLDRYHENIFDELLIAIGYKHMEFRKSIFERFLNEVPFATLVHTSSLVDKSSKIGKGVVIYPGCIIDFNVTIEDNVLLNVGCCIAHDSRIGNHSFLSPRVAIAGFTSIGDKNILGINSTIIDNILTVSGVQIGGGAVVIKNIEKSGLYVGNPIKYIR